MGESRKILAWSENKEVKIMVGVVAFAVLGVVMLFIAGYLLVKVERILVGLMLFWGTMMICLSLMSVPDIIKGQMAGPDKLEIGAVYETLSSVPVKDGVAVVVQLPNGKLIALQLPQQPPKYFVVAKDRKLMVVLRPKS